MGKYKDYVFQHQKRRFRLRIYSHGIASKIFMDNQLRDVSVANGMDKTVLDFYFRDARNQEHRVHVERKLKWFSYIYDVYYAGQGIYTTADKQSS